MERLSRLCALVLAVLALTAGQTLADVKVREKTQVKFEGFLGTMMKMFGGKAASEGIVSNDAVKGSRKATLGEETGRIVDLTEEKIYDLDMRKKTYTVMTFEEMRRRLREAQERAAKSSPKDEQAQKPAGSEPELEFDVQSKETGQTRTIAGYNAREIITTITVRQKGKTLEDGGGFVINADSWIGPEIPALKELMDFELRYWKAIAPETTGISAEQMAAAAALYPMIKPAMERLSREQVNMKGTPLAGTMTFESVASKEQATQQSESNSGGGLSGMLARKMMKKDNKPRATILTMNSEKLEIANAVTPADLEIPAGFKQK
jgi:hypothetical protein